MQLTSDTQEAILKLRAEGWQLRHFESFKGTIYDTTEVKYVVMCFSKGDGYTEEGNTLEEAYLKLWEKAKTHEKSKYPDTLMGKAMKTLEEGFQKKLDDEAWDMIVKGSP